MPICSHANLEDALETTNWCATNRKARAPEELFAKFNGMQASKANQQKCDKCSQLSYILDELMVATAVPIHKNKKQKIQKATSWFPLYHIRKMV